VCQAKSGRWTVVGLVTWGVGCASHVPGVYARVSEFQSWIDAN
jgi:serine protease 7 (enterokinase)/suppressor of tumorigenicity protein 14